MDDGGRRRARLLAGAVAALLVWGVLVSRAVAEGRELRLGDGSWALLVLWLAGAALCLYAAGTLAARSRRAATPPPPPRSAPRHRG